MWKALMVRCWHATCPTGQARCPTLQNHLDGWDGQHLVALQRTSVFSRRCRGLAEWAHQQPIRESTHVLQASVQLKKGFQGHGAVSQQCDGPRGKAPQCSWVRRVQVLVERLRWVSDSVHLELLALCQCLPGPTSTQLSFAMGITQQGVPGGLLSGAESLH